MFTVQGHFNKTFHIFLGNGTLIGASANVVCAGVAEQHGKFSNRSPVQKQQVSNFVSFHCRLSIQFH